MREAGRYPSKIMLVGEYGVVVGGAALTIPFHRYCASVRDRNDIPDGKSGEAELSHKHLVSLYNYIRDLPPGAFHAGPDLDLFSTSLEKYWLETNIPTGYGLGSSGAVSAAIYDLFFPESGIIPLARQKEDLALIESYFHGKSSGVDALTCHTGQALFFHDDGSVQMIDFKPSEIPGGYRFFLMDSGIRLETGPLVNYFLEQLKDPLFAESVRNEYLVMNLKLIETLLGHREADPALIFRAISDYQFTNFRKMIPDDVLDLWIGGQVSNEYYLKLNGSGGGFLLGIAHHTSMGSLYKRWKEQIIWIE
jgi:mevalonate kinase